MRKFLLPIFFGLFACSSLSAQCDLMAEVSDLSCDPTTGETIFRLTVTGSEETYRFTDFNLELSLPFDDFFIIPLDGLDSVVLRIDSGTEPDICRDSVVVYRPVDCTGSPSNCFTRIEPAGRDECGVPDSLVAIVTGTAPFTYEWSTGATTATIATQPDQLFYDLTVTDAAGCTSFAHYFLSNASLFVHVESSGNACRDEIPTLTASVYPEEGTYTFLWSTGDTTQSITGVSPEELYSVTVTDAAGCSATGTGLYHPGGFGVWLEIEGPTSIGCDGDSITLSVIDPQPDVVYTWINGFDTLTGPSITVVEGGYFQVIGNQIDNPGCQSFGGYEVQDFNFSPEDLAIVDLLGFCDPERACFGVVNTQNLNLLFHPVEVIWSSPTGDDFGEQFGTICVRDPGVYQATIITPCDTVVLFTEVKDFEPCTDLCGTITMDVDEDCLPDADQPEWWSVPVMLTNDSTNVSYFIHANLDGSFCATVPTGSYQMTMTSLDGMMVSTDCETNTSSMVVGLAGANNMELFARFSPEEAPETSTSVFTAAASSGQLNVYPNPGDGSIRIAPEGLDLVASDVLTVYDALGRLQDRTTVAGLPVPWRPRGLTSGMYQLVVTAENGRLKARSTVVVR